MGTPKLFEDVWKLILDLKRDHREPTQIRLGADDYYLMQRTYGAQSPYANPVVDILNPDGEVRMYGVPVRPLPIPHAVSVI